MSRLVLLGLGEDDVDVLSHISLMDPRPEVLAVHPDPAALILCLASLAEFPALTEPPRPRPDDVVVVPVRRGGPADEMVEPWREVGARIIHPDDVGRERTLVTSALEQARASWAAVSAAGPAPTPAVGASSESDPAEPVAVASKLPEDNRPTPYQAKEFKVTPEAGPPASPPGEAAPPPDIWKRPEDSFRYLVCRAIGEDAGAVLWWDGMTDVWVPWVTVGSAPGGAAAEEPGAGIEIPSSWGRFRLSGAGEDGGRLNLDALARVAEDMALRDLMGWRRRAHALAAHGLPDPQADGPALAAWATPVLDALGASAALFWHHEGAGWKLVQARGEGVGFTGSLVLPKALLAATFETDASPWRRWDPAPEIRIHLAGIDADPHWPLKLRRVELALAGEVPTW